jgi:hypothetical protein
MERELRWRADTRDLHDGVRPSSFDLRDELQLGREVDRERVDPGGAEIHLQTARPSLSA